MSISQSLPKLFKEAYQNYKYKDYGIGRYKQLFDYSKDTKECKEFTDSQGQTLTRGDFFIHGGEEAGSAGCIDLWDKNELFFEKFLEYVEKYRNEILKNQGKIPLIVKYEDNTRLECDNNLKYCKPINDEGK